MILLVNIRFIVRLHNKKPVNFIKIPSGGINGENFSPSKTIVAKKE